MSIFGLDLKSLRRTQKAVRWAESQYGSQGNGIPPAIPLEGDSEVWFKCDGTAPGGYDGSGWFPGSVIDVRAGLTQVALGNGLLVDPNGVALEPDGIYRAIYYGLEDWDGGKRPAYLVTGAASEPATTANPIGETCQGYYNGGSRVTSGGAFGYGYTEVSVPVGASASPYATLQTWRLHHGAEINTNNGPWSANQFTPTSGYVLPEMPTAIGLNSVEYKLRFTGKRGALVSGTTYDCLQYKLDSFTVIGQMVCVPGEPAKFKLYGKNQVYFESGHVLGITNGVSFFARQVQWSALYDGTATTQKWAAMYRTLTPLVGTFPALIGFDMDIGWHIRATTNATLSTQNTSGVVI
jgi:hypothetical protein